MTFKFKARSLEEAMRYARADERSKKLEPALAKLGNDGDQLLARVLFNCPFWHTDPTMITYPGHRTAVEALGERDMITTRTHFADEYPNGIVAFEITENGLDLLENLVGSELADEALEQRAWYRENSSYEGWMKRVRQSIVKRALDEQKAKKS
jgi:hypothetical protein